MKILAGLIVLAAVVASFATGVALADHFTLKAMDKTKQDASAAGNDYPEIHVNKKWALETEGTAVTWYADSATRAPFKKALLAWTTAVTPLEWDEAFTLSNPDVHVYEQDVCSKRPGFAGSFIVEKTNWYGDTKRQANYWSTATAGCATSSPPGTGTAASSRPTSAHGSAASS